MSTFFKRLVGAARLNTQTFEEIEADTRGTWQAVAVVVLSSLAGGIGVSGFGGFGPRALVLGTLAALVGWIAWTILTYVLGTRVFPEPQTHADAGELLRTIGFASAPGLLRVIGVVPGLAWPVYMVTSVWMLAATVIAVRQALDFSSTIRALAVCATGWLVSLVLAFIAGIAYGPVVH